MFRMFRALYSWDLFQKTLLWRFFSDGRLIVTLGIHLNKQRRGWFWRSVYGLLAYDSSGSLWDPCIFVTRSGNSWTRLLAYNFRPSVTLSLHHFNVQSCFAAQHILVFLKFLCTLRRLYHLVHAESLTRTVILTRLVIDRWILLMRISLLHHHCIVVFRHSSRDLKRLPIFRRTLLVDWSQDLSQAIFRTAKSIFFAWLFILDILEDFETLSSSLPRSLDLWATYVWWWALVICHPLANGRVDLAIEEHLQIL